MYMSNSSHFNADHRADLNLDASQHTTSKVYPYVNNMYNMYMNEVDVLDQLVASYDRQHRHKSWKQQAYHTAWTILAVLAYNMYLFNEKCRDNSNPMSHFLFKQSIARALIQRVSPRIDLSSVVDFGSEVTSAVLHPFHRMSKRKHCKFMVPNPNFGERRKHRVVQCGAKSWNACQNCTSGKDMVTYLCKKHYELHREE